MTKCPLTYHASCRVFWWNIKSPRWLSLLLPRFGALWLLAFPKTKITFEWEEISDHQWDSGKYDGAADGGSNKTFFIAFWTVEETLGKLCEVPRCLVCSGLRHHCPMYNVSCIFYLLHHMSLVFILHGWIPSGQTLYYCGIWFALDTSLLRLLGGKDGKRSIKALWKIKNGSYTVVSTAPSWKSTHVIVFCQTYIGNKNFNKEGKGYS